MKTSFSGPLFHPKGMNNNNGFTLMELLLYIAIGSFILLTMFSLMRFTIQGYIKGQNEDEILLNGRHAIEYIKKEIKGADKILSTGKISDLDDMYKDNIGFVIYKFDPDEPRGYSYNYVTFYHKDNKIYRIATNRANETLPKAGSFSGFNIVAENVNSIKDTYIDFETKIIHLNFILRDDTNRDYKFQSTIGVRCTVEY